MAITTVAAKPIVLKDLTLVIADYDFSTSVSGVLFTPKTTTQTWRGGKPSATFSDSVVDSWDCKIDYAQDWATANALAQFLKAHAGEHLDAAFIPNNDDDAEVTATVIAMPGPIGGQVGQWLTGSVTLGVDGEPDLGVAA